LASARFWLIITNVDRKIASSETIIVKVDLHRAQSKADNAEDDAAFAIDYAYGAIEEAEYAVLDAALARMDADELAGAGASA
jgi:hypothetical protein